MKARIRNAARGLAVLVHFLSWAETASAQSFFADLVLDPVVGADRGSASQIQKQDEPARFVTLSTTGSKAAGRTVLGFGQALPDFAQVGDQFDLALVWAGPSEDGWRELLAGGVAYRFPLGSPETTAFVNADYGDLVLGTAEALALEVTGDRIQVAAGLIHRRDLGETAELRFSAEIIARNIGSEIFGATAIDESLRMFRASVLYTKGLPFLFRQRLAASLTKGFAWAGASPVSNPFSSVPGAASDFLRLSFAAETSVPLSKVWAVNAGLIGQWTRDTLPASQRCGFESNQYARGFDYALVVGDRCLGTRIEAAYNFELPAPGADRLLFTQGFAGIDGGIIENVGNALMPGRTDHWSSLSVGIRTLRGNFLGEIAATRILSAPDVAASQDEARLWIRTALKF